MTAEEILQRVYKHVKHWPDVEATLSPHDAETMTIEGEHGFVIHTADDTWVFVSAQVIHQGA